MAAKQPMSYDEAKTRLKAFLAEFHLRDAGNGKKDFVYARQLTSIAHRDQVIILINYHNYHHND